MSRSRGDSKIWRRRLATGSLFSPWLLHQITGWRIPGEVLKLQWRHVDFEARVVRLDPHTTKNDEGRTFPFTDALERLLEAQKAEHERLKAEGVICPWVSTARIAR